MNSDSKLWTPQFIIAVLIQFGANFGFFLLYSTIGIYATSMTSVELYIGIVTGVFTFASLFTRFFSGKMIKQFSCKPIILFGLAINVLSFVAYFFRHSLPLLIAVRMLNGLGHGFTTAALATFISTMLPPARLLEGLGYSMMMITLCAAIGPTVG
ncbi:MAG: MFS transporter, partial [Peptococcaceae bacterium]|nr:MFS transporter [Peptococcaceae bacterium]